MNINVQLSQTFALKTLIQLVSLLFLGLDHCDLLLLLACEKSKERVCFEPSLPGQTCVCGGVFVCVHTDRFEGGGQRVSVGLAPTNGENLHGLRVHDAL